MDLRELEYFREVCRTGNFTRAAANLYIAQPGVTTAVHKLETELGVQLLHRTNKTVTMTPEGQHFYERVAAILGFVDEITQEIRDFNPASPGSFKLGISPQVGANLFPDVFMEFGALYPNITPSIFEEGSVATISLLEKGELDVGMIVLPDSAPKLHTHWLRQEPLMLNVSPRHRLSGLAAVDFGQLREEKFILRKSHSFHRDIILEECQKHGFVPNVILSSNELQTIKSLVAKNIGIAFFMEMTTRNDSSIVSIPFAQPLSVPIGLAWKKDRYISKAAQAFIDFAIARFETASPAK